MKKTHIIQLYLLLTFLFVSACAKHVVLPKTDQVLEIEVEERNKSGDGREWMISDYEKIERILNVLRTVPPVQNELNLNVATNTPSPYVFTLKGKHGDISVFELGRQTLQGQKTTWPMSPKVYEKLLSLLGLNEFKEESRSDDFEAKPLLLKNTIPKTEVPNL